MMKRLFISLYLLAASAVFASEVDRVCRNGICEVLTVQDGVVRLVDSVRTLDLGKQVPAAQTVVPRNEAPIRVLRSLNGWRILISAFLAHSGESEAGLRVRFFGADARLRTTDTVLIALEQVEIGRLFGSDDDILALQSNEEHSYNSTADIWLLPERGRPKRLIHANATIGNFIKNSGTRPGIWIRRQTYDGVSAETKGWVDEFWVWDAKNKSLALRQE
jgi:hypothetical protein